MGRGSSKAGSGGNAAKIKHGETVFAAFPPNSLYPNGSSNNIVCCLEILPTLPAAGLYQRKKTYKSVDDFKKDAMKRVNSRSEYNDAELRALKDGYVSQIQAENWKTLLTKKTPSDALKQMQKDIKEDMKYLKERQKAADMARAKIKRIGGN